MRKSTTELLAYLAYTLNVPPIYNFLQSNSKRHKPKRIFSQKYKRYMTEDEERELIAKEVKENE